MRFWLYHVLSFFTALIIISGCKETQVAGGSLIDKTMGNGIYTGMFSSFPNSADVEVEIMNNKIKTIKILHHGAWRGRKAEKIIIKRILETQSTKVDTVTGATNSSIVIMNAVDDAIRKSIND